MTTNFYMNMLIKLQTMDKRQLIQMFHDLEDIETVRRINDAAFKFTEEYKEPEEDGEHEWVDWKRQDDAQRYADIKSTQDSFK